MADLRGKRHNTSIKSVLRWLHSHTIAKLSKKGTK